MRNKISAVRWLAMAVYFAGFVFVFFTKNSRWLTLFGLVSSTFLCFDLYVLTPRPKLSLLHSGQDAKPKFRWPSRLEWVAFVLLLIAFICFSRVRLSALLMMSGLSLAAYEQYQRPGS